MLDNPCYDLKMTDYSIIRGSLVIVANTGVLITGEPGVGKSAAAINLALKGFCIVCDELVRIHRSAEGKIIGEAVKCPAQIEVRGLGIFLLDDLFPELLRSESGIDIIVELANFDGSLDLGRVTPEIDLVELMGISVPRFRTPVTAGLAAHSLIELAVRLNRKSGSEGT